jgi:hypothetical protein
MCIFKEAFMAKQTMIAVAFLVMCGGIQAAAGGEPLQLAMGPDPGGKTGQGVTPESTKTDHPQGNKAIKGGEVKDPRADDRAQGAPEGDKDRRR